MHEQDGNPEDPLFPSRRSGRLSPDAVQRLVARHVATAQRKYPSLAAKRITAHTLRHYVDGWVMWLAAASPLVAEPREPVPAT
jgi:integrase